MSRTICAIDVETTGVDMLHADIVEISIVPATFNKKGLIVDSSKVPLSILVKPKDFELKLINCDVKNAMYFNKISPEIVNKDGMNPDHVLPYIKGWMRANSIEHMTPLGHNFSFDRVQLQKLLSKEGFDELMHHRYKDSHTSALFINDMYEMKGLPVPFKSTRLTDLAKHFGWKDTSGAHRAQFDCELTIFVYNKLLEMGVS